MPSASSFFLTRGSSATSSDRRYGSRAEAKSPPSTSASPSSSRDRALPGSRPSAVEAVSLARATWPRAIWAAASAWSAGTDAGWRKRARRAKRSASAGSPAARRSRLFRVSGSSSGALPSAVSTLSTSERGTA